jgi:hypothetical protein
MENMSFYDKYQLVQSHDISVRDRIQLVFFHKNDEERFALRLLFRKLCTKELNNDVPNDDYQDNLLGYFDFLMEDEQNCYFVKRCFYKVLDDIKTKEERNDNIKTIVLAIKNSRNNEYLKHILMKELKSEKELFEAMVNTNGESASHSK